MVDEDREALRAGELDGEHLDTRQGVLDLPRDLAVGLLLPVVDLRQNRLSLRGDRAPIMKNGRHAPISPSR